MARDKVRKLALPLSFTSLLTIVFLAVAAMAGAYVWGVMSGRHGEAAPKAEVAAPAAEKAPRPVLPEPDPEILKARELEFAHVLKGEPRPPARTEQPGIAKPPKAVENDPRPAVPAPAEAGTAPEGGPKVEAKEPEAPEGIVPGQLFDYVFQMAALKDEQAVDSLRQKLEGRGMRTRMERGGRLYLVLVLLRGDSARAAEIVQAARELRLGEPLLRSRKPVAP